MRRSPSTRRMEEFADDGVAIEPCSSLEELTDVRGQLKKLRNERSFDRTVCRKRRGSQRWPCYVVRTEAARRVLANHSKRELHNLVQHDRAGGGARGPDLRARAQRLNTAAQGAFRTAAASEYWRDTPYGKSEATWSLHRRAWI